MKVDYNYLGQQFAEVEEYFQDLRELVKSGEFTLGPYVDKFEKKFAKYIGVKHVISTNTGTDALVLCMKAIGIKPGDEVITAANTFYATAGAVVAAGGRPVFVDIDDRHVIDASKIEKAITPRTKAIIPVHWAGCPADIEAVLKVAAKHRLDVVEDACPSVGAEVNGKPVGSFGRINGFSMHPLKPLHVWGDGGMVGTNDDKLAEWLRLYRNHGMTDRDHISMWGVNCRLQPFQAVVGCRVLDTVKQSADLRIRNARLLDEGLSGLGDSVVVPPRLKNFREVYQLYLISCKDRDRLLAHLIRDGIDAKVHYPVPLHLQKPGRELGYKEGDFPVAEKRAKEVITLPAHQYVTPEQVAYMVKSIRAFYRA